MASKLKESVITNERRKLIAEIAGLVASEYSEPFSSGRVQVNFEKLAVDVGIKLVKSGRVVIPNGVTKRDGRRYIVVPRDCLTKRGEEIQLAHEFGHHLLGHLSWEYERLPEAVAEAEADWFSDSLIGTKGLERRGLLFLEVLYGYVRHPLSSAKVILGLDEGDISRAITESDSY